MCRKLMCLISFVFVFSLAVNPVGADPFTQDPGPDDIVTIEAENFDDNTTDGTRIWEFNTDPNGFSGIGFMRAVPDGSGSGSPQMDYEINFIKTGTYFVWVRGYSTSGTDDSCHAGLDGDETTADRIQAGGGNGPWVWSNNRRDNQGRAQVTVETPGVHVFHVRMREDGWRFDKALLTTPFGIFAVVIGIAHMGVTPAPLLDTIRIVGRAIHFELIVFLAGLYLFVAVLDYSGLVNVIAWRMPETFKIPTLAWAVLAVPGALALGHALHAMFLGEAVIDPVFLFAFGIIATVTAAVRSNRPDWQIRTWPEAGTIPRFERGER